MDTENNQLSLCGVIETAPVMDHEVFGEHFYHLDLRVPRLSGAQDLLPVTVSHLIEEGKARVAVLDCPEKWYGVTYKEDRPAIVAAMKAKKDEGLYPEDLWK